MLSIGGRPLFSSDNPLHMENINKLWADLVAVQQRRDTSIRLELARLVLVILCGGEDDDDDGWGGGGDDDDDGWGGGGGDDDDGWGGGGDDDILIIDIVLVTYLLFHE